MKFLDFKLLTNSIFSNILKLLATNANTALAANKAVVGNLSVDCDIWFRFCISHNSHFLIKRSLTHFKTKAISGREKQFVFTFQQIEVLTTYSSCTLQQMINTQIHTQITPLLRMKGKKGFWKECLKKSFTLRISSLTSSLANLVCIHFSLTSFSVRQWKCKFLQCAT